jgi:hypothetical protein
LSSTVQSKSSCLAMGKAMWFAIQMTVVWFQGHKQISNFHLLLTTFIRKLVSFTDFTLTSDCFPHSLSLSTGTRRTNLEHSCVNHSLSVRIAFNNLHDTLTSFTTSTTVIHQFARTSSLTFKTVSASQKLVSHCNAHLEAILAHFLSDCTNPTQLLF